jgi:NO-binding membrane sensor protein with MHYT domain
MFLTWVAFGAAARKPSTAAAAGSVLLWLFVAVMGVIGLRRLRRRG